MTDQRSRFSLGHRILSGFLAWIMFFSPILVLAENAPRLPESQVPSSESDYWADAANPNTSQRDQAMSAGAFGSQVGKSIGENAILPSTNSDGSFNLGTTTDEDGNTFQQKGDASSFFPGTSGTSNNPGSSQFPGAQQPNIESLKQADNDSIRENSGAFKSALFSDAQKDDPDTVMGSAYKILVDGASRGRPDLRNDPNFARTKDVYSQAESLTGEFSDCDLTNQLTPTTEQVRVPDYKMCRRMRDKSEECTIKHEYSTAVLEVYGGTNINLTHKATPTGGYFLGWIGKKGDNYWSGWCDIFTQKTTYRVINPQAITKVTIDYAKYDDYMQIYIGKGEAERKVWNGPNNNFPPEKGDQCELSTSWSQSLSVDVTDDFKNTPPGGLVDFKIRVSVAGNGEGYARLNIQYDESKVMTQDVWIPSTDSCIDSANATRDSYVGGGYECIDQPTQDENGCITNDQGMRICPDNFITPPIPIAPSCKKVLVEADYSFYAGEGCYFDRDGNEVCQTVPQMPGGGTITDCEQYEADPQCSFVRDECVGGMEGAETGNCYIQSETWDCGTWVDVPDYQANQNVQCNGTFLCQGDDCSDVETTTSGSFNRAAAMLQAANFMAMDGVCDEVDVNQNRNCKVFGGEGLECKIVGLPSLGIDAVDCCDQPVEVTPGMYIGMMAKVGVMDAAFMSVDPSSTFGGVQGAYTTLRDPVVNSLTKVTEPFTSATETVTGPIKDFVTDNLTEPLEGFLVDLKAKVSEQLSQFFAEQGAQGAAQAGAGAGTGAGAEAGAAAAETAGGEVAGALGAAGNVLGAIMGAYTAVMIAYMALQIIFECTEDEIKLAVKRELKSCESVGSYCYEKICVVPTTFGCAARACVQTRDAYCCYNSPLSRIVMSQAAEQLGRPGRKGLGTAENPQCGGLPLSDLEKLDWDRIDLSEWTGLLQQEGALNNKPGDLSFDALTGNGNAFAMPEKYGDRENTITRTQERLENGSPDDMRVIQGQKFSFDPDGNSGNNGGTGSP